MQVFSSPRLEVLVRSGAVRLHTAEKHKRLSAASARFNCTRCPEEQRIAIASAIAAHRPRFHLLSTMFQSPICHSLQFHPQVLVRFRFVREPHVLPVPLKLPSVPQGNAAQQGDLHNGRCELEVRKPYSGELDWPLSTTAAIGERPLTRIIHGPGVPATRCPTPPQSASEDKWRCGPRLRFGLVWDHE